MGKVDVNADAIRMVEEFNSKKLPYYLEIVNLDGIDEKFIVARWKWMDATYFGGISITNEIKEFATYIKLDSDGTYRWFDTENAIYSKFSPTEISAGGSSFYGKSWRYNKTIVLGKDNDTNNTGIVKFSLNTKTIHKPIEEWLKNNNYKKRKTTFKEHVESFKASQNPVLGSIVGLGFSFGGIIFFIVGLIFIINGLTGNYITIHTNNTDVISKGSTISFGAFFSLLSLPFLIMGIPLTKMFLPKCIKNLKEKKKNNN